MVDKPQHKEPAAKAPAPIDFNSANAIFAKVGQWLAFLEECRIAVAAAQAVQQDVEYLKAQREAAAKDLQELEEEKTKQHAVIELNKSNSEKQITAIREATESARVAENEKLAEELQIARKKMKDETDRLADELTLLQQRKEIAEEAATAAESRLANLQAEIRKLRGAAENILAKQ